MESWEFELFISGASCGTFWAEGDCESDAYDKAYDEIADVLSQLPVVPEFELCVA